MDDRLFQFLAAATIAATLLWPIIALGLRVFRPRGRAMIVVIFASTVLPAVVACSWTGLFPLPLRGPIQSRYVDAVSSDAPPQVSFGSESTSTEDYANGTDPTRRSGSTAAGNDSRIGSYIRYILLCYTILVAVSFLVPFFELLLMRRRAVRRSYSDRGEGRALDLLGAVCDRFGIRRPPELLYSENRHAPLYFGFPTPLIVLPDEAIFWTDEQIECALSHEIAHMKHRDHLTLALHIVLRSFLFFHPMMLLLSRHLSLELEYRADTETIRRIPDRTRYASFLYEIALGSHFNPARMLSMKSWLRKRIERITEPGSNIMKRNINNLFALLATAMLMVAGVWLAAPPLYADGTPDAGTDSTPFVRDGERIGISPARVHTFRSFHNIRYERWDVDTDLPAAPMTFHDGMFARLDTILDARFAVSYGFETKIDRVYLDPYVTSVSDLPFILIPGIGAYPSKRDGLYLVIRIAPASEAPKAAAERYMVLFGDPESVIVWKLIEDMRKELSTAFRDIDGSLPGARSVPIVLFDESTCGESTTWARSGSTIHGDGTITIEGDEYRSVSQITIEPILGSSATR